MAISSASSPPPLSPAPLPRTPSGAVNETPLTKLINGLALPFIPSPKRKPLAKEPRAPSTAIRNLNYTNVILEFSKSKKFVPPSPQPNDIPAPPTAAVPSGSTTPRTYQHTPHPDGSSPSLPRAPRGEKTATSRVLFPDDSSASSTITPLVDQSAFDNILKSKITTYEIAVKTHAIAERCFSLAFAVKDNLEECERYILDAQTLLYKILNYLRSKNLDTKEELWLLTICKIDMVRTSGDEDLMIYWFNEALKSLDDFFKRSIIREEIEICQELYAYISEICPEDPQNSSDFIKISEHSATKTAECTSRLKQLNQRPEAPLIVAEQPPAKEKPPTRITIRRVFAFTMTLLIAGLAITQRARIRSIFGNNLREFPTCDQLTPLYNRIILTFKNYIPRNMKN